MIYKKNDLTNEQLKGRFPSQFELTNAAIDIARRNIHDNQQTSMLEVLEEVSEVPLIKREE